MTDESGEDAKIIAMPHASVTSEYDHIHDVDDLPDLLKAQISQFFEHYKELEPDKWVKVEGWGDINDARAEILISYNRLKASKEQ